MTDVNSAEQPGERPVLAAAVPVALPSSRLMVLMFTDLVGSVKLKAELGLSVYAKLLARHDALFRSIVAATPGAEVRQDTGDGFYAAFATPSDAVFAGLRFQLGLRAGAWDPKPLGVRVGIHLGQMEQVSPADAEGYTKLVGLGADLAARVMSLALPGQVLMTRGVFDDARLYVRSVPTGAPGDPVAAPGPVVAGAAAATRPDAPPQWLAHGRYRLAGQDEPVDVYEAGVAGVSPLVPPPDSEKAKRFLAPDEELTLGWRPAAGRDIPGRPGWHVDRKLGEGGFGEVWLGRHGKTKTERVFKFCFDADRLRSLKRELTLFRLMKEALGDRPDIAKLHDVRLDKPPFFLESDYSPLGDLRDWAERQGGIAAVPIEVRLDVVARIADAVAAAHSVGVLHKDIKPQNVLMYEAEAAGPRPRLADFGIGILTDRGRLAQLHITAAGYSQTLLTQNESSRTGTRVYAPPELLAGKAFTTQGDVYALGVLLYQMVVGDLARPLAAGWERDVADDLLREDVAACVEGDPARRLSAAAELRDRLNTTPERRVAREAKNRAAQFAVKRRRTLRLLSVAAGLSAILFVMAIIFLSRERTLRERAELTRRIAEDARESAERAKAATQLEVAQGMVFQADALVAAKRWQEAKDRYRAAHNAYAALGHDTLLADLGLTAAWRTAPEPVNVIDHAATADLSAAQPIVGITLVPGTTKGTKANFREKDNVGYFDMLNGVMHKQVTISGSRLRSISANENNTLLVVTSNDRSVNVIKSETGEMIRRLICRTGASAAAFSADDRWVVSGEGDGTVRTWDLSTGMAVAAIKAHKREVTGVAVSRDGRFVASSSLDGTLSRSILVGDSSDNKSIGLSSPVWSLALSQDGRTAFAGLGDATIVEIDFVDWKINRVLRGHGNLVRWLAISSDGRFLASASSDKTAKIWDLRTGVDVRTLAGHPVSADRVAISPDARLVVTGTELGALHVWSGPVGCGEPTFGFGRDAARCLAISTDGLTLLAGQQNGEVVLWDTATGCRLQTFNTQFLSPVNSVSISADQSRVSAGCSDAKIRIWDVNSGEIVQILQSRSTNTSSVRFSPTGRTLIASSTDGNVECWDWQRGNLIQRALISARGINAVLVSPDGRTLVTAGGNIVQHPDNVVKLWGLTDAGIGKDAMQVCSGHTNGVFAVAATSDFDLLASAGMDQTIRVWERSSGSLRAILKGHTSTVTSIAISANKRFIASGSIDRTFRLWRLDDGSLIREFGADRVNSVLFAPAGDVVYAATNSGIERIELNGVSDYLASESAASRAIALTRKEAGGPSEWETLALWYARKGLYDWAIQMHNRAGPQRKGGVDDLGIARWYWQAGLFDEAEVRFGHLLSDEPAPDKRVYLGRCLDGIRASKRSFGVIRVVASRPSDARSQPITVPSADGHSSVPDRPSLAAARAPLQPGGIVSEFWFDIRGIDKPGTRHWVRLADGVWEERYGDGEATRFTAGGTYERDGVSRELLNRATDGNRKEPFQVLIPLPVEGSFLEFRYGTGSWRKLGPVRFVEKPAAK
jgi:WD40 repeat protein/class 3 adenylate cyclase